MTEDATRGAAYTPAMAADTHETLAAQLAEDAAERFLRYVRFDTPSDEDSESCRRSASQTQRSTSTAT